MFIECQNRKQFVSFFSEAGPGPLKATLGLGPAHGLMGPARGPMGPAHGPTGQKIPWVLQSLFFCVMIHFMFMFLYFRSYHAHVVCLFYYSHFFSGLGGPGGGLGEPLDPLTYIISLRKVLYIYIYIIKLSPSRQACYIFLTDCRLKFDVFPGHASDGPENLRTQTTGLVWL